MNAAARPARLIMVLLLAGVTGLLLALGPIIRSAPALAPPAPPLPLRDLGPPRVSSKDDATRPKIAPELQQAVRAATGPDARLPVIVVSRGGFAHRALVSGVSRPPNPLGLTFTSGQASAGQIATLAADPQVIAVLSGTAPPPPPLPGFSTPRPRPDCALRIADCGSKTGAGIKEQDSATPDKSTTPAAPRGLPNPQSAIENPQSWHTVDVQNVRPAWQAGYRGDGVKVAVLDTGVDFGHPDLQGTTARVDDPGSPYYGWPLAFDPHSMYLYANGIVGDRQNAINAYGSWYVDTSTRVSGPTAGFITLLASGNGVVPVNRTYQLTGNSRSGVYRMGLLPDEHLAFDVYGEYVAVLLVDTHVAGQYDTLYVDLNHNYDFRDDAAQYKGHEVAALDTNGDGLGDLSAGMLYFIADGVHPVPAGDWMFGLGAPANGDLVAMMGSYDYDEHHGTGCASSVVAQGIVDGPNPLRPPWKPSGVGGMVQGTAPRAELLAVGNVYRDGQGFYSAYDFITYGLDGRPNTGDEPQIASMSYGFSGGFDNGWDFQSRYITLLAQAAPALSWLGATGNGGPGYGTITAPSAAPVVLSVGAATQYGENTQFDPISSTEEITWGDIQPWSNRGPSHLGKPGPDVVAVGAWGTADTPLNVVGNGSTAYSLWGGTSMSTPTAAGVLALLYQAYRQAHGAWPTRDQARSLLMSSATDLGYDPFTQGAGLANGIRAVDLARGAAGLQVSPPSWIAGQQYAGNTGVVLPGAAATQVFTLTNPTGSPIQAALGTSQLVEASHIDWVQQVHTSRESEPDFIRPDYLYNLTAFIPPDADFLKVTAVISYSQFSLSAPNASFLFWNNALTLLAYDWHDKNHDGQTWTDLNANATVNDGEYQVGELNRLMYAYPKHTTWEGYVANPRSRMHDGLWIGLQHDVRDEYFPDTQVRLRATFYKRAPWPLGSVSPATVTIPAHGSAQVTARVDVPASAAPGTREGALLISSGGQHTLVPVALQVAAPGFPATFGGTPPSGTLYDPGRTSGQLDWAWRPEAGEWRQFFANNPTPPAPGTYFWAGADWPTYPTDKDLILLGNSPWDYFSGQAPQVFGPTGMAWLGSTASVYLFGGAWQWGTLTGTTEDWVAGPALVSGLHEMVLHDTFYSGATFSEPFTATLGTVHLDPTALEIHSNNLRDQTVLTFTTAMTLPGLAANAYGLSQQSRLPNNPIQAYHTWFHEFSLTNTASIDISTDASDPFDLYLYLDHWTGTRWDWVATSAGGGPNQAVHLSPAPDGAYRIRIDAGYIPAPGGIFNLTIRAIHGGDMFVIPSVITGTIAAGTTVTFTVGYSRTQMDPGIYDGQLFLGPRAAPALQSLPITVYYGNPVPIPTSTPGPCRIRFTDVPPTDWARPYIEFLWCHSVVTGYYDNTFRPGGTATRVQFAKMLVTALGWPQADPATQTFADVFPTFWGYGYIEAAAAHGVIRGYPCGGPGEPCDPQQRPYFHPVAGVSRAQIVKMIVLAKDWLAPPGPGTPTPPPTPAAAFQDVPPGHWAYPYVQVAVARGVVVGYGGTFRPEVLATRAQLAKMIYMMMQQ